MTSKTTNTTTEKVVEESKEMMDQAQEKAADMATTVKKETKAVAEQAADQARSMAATRKEDVVYELEGVAHALRDVGDTLTDQDQGHLAKYSNQAADRIERVHDYLEARDVGDLIADAEDFGRRQPELFLGGAFTAGLLIGRFFKSSAGNQQRQRSRRSQESERGGYTIRTPADNAGPDRYHSDTAHAAAATPYAEES